MENIFELDGAIEARYVDNQTSPTEMPEVIFKYFITTL